MSARRKERRNLESEDDDQAASEESADLLPIKRKRGRPTNASRLLAQSASKSQSTSKSQKKSVYDVPSDEDGLNDNDVPESRDLAGTPRSRKPKKQSLASVRTLASEEPATVHSRTPQKRKAVDISATETPTRGLKSHVNGETPKWRRNDRSARKKSARALIESVVRGEASDDDDGQDIAREIYETSDEEEEEDVDELVGDEDMQDGGDLDGLAASPSKKPRGRKKGSTTRARKKSPTPPRDLPPHELYFLQNRPGASKTSGNNLASLQLLTHEEYFSIWNGYKDSHQEDIQFLQDLHADSYPQWAFELSQGFSVCCYGYGSKRSLLHRFARYLYDTSSDHVQNKIVVVNGYVRNTSIRELLSTIGSAVDSSYRSPAGNPSAMLTNLKSFLSSHNVNITVILNSIDAVPLRKSGMQAILAQLASHPSVQLICSADTPDFTLLWDSGLHSAFNFAFHDCTTFSPFTAEMDVVDDVHELLGRKARRVGGKEGVAYVLRSLPENAKNLFRLLVTEVLVAIDDEGVSAGENPGVEYRMLYSKAVEEFICSSEMAFRTLLKEFHDHQIITSRKDVLGTELLSAPFRKEELEAILEDLMS